MPEINILLFGRGLTFGQAPKNLSVPYGIGRCIVDLFAVLQVSKPIVDRVVIHFHKVAVFVRLDNHSQPISTDCEKEIPDDTLCYPLAPISSLPKTYDRYAGPSRRPSIFSQHAKRLGNALSQFTAAILHSKKTCSLSLLSVGIAMRYEN